MGLTKQLAKRLDEIEIVLAMRPDPHKLDVIQAIPTAFAGGRAPGLYHVGPPGSTAGVLVYDPALGSPVLPRNEQTEHAMFIVCEPTSFQPGIDYVDEP